MTEGVEVQHGGKREGAGRPRGSANRRTAALREAIEAEGVDPAVALVRIAKAAEEREEFPLAVEAYGKVMPFLHSRPKPTEADPDALIALERALLRMKIEETAEAVKRDEGLAERLARAKKRKLAAEVAEIFDALADAAEDAQVIDASPTPTVAPTPAPAPSAGSAAPAQPAPASEYRPILPRPALAATTDWAAPRVEWPEKQAFADGGRSDFDLQPYDADPLGFLANR